MRRGQDTNRSIHVQPSRSKHHYFFPPPIMLVALRRSSNKQTTELLALRSFFLSFARMHTHGESTFLVLASHSHFSFVCTDCANAQQANHSINNQTFTEWFIDDYLFGPNGGANPNISGFFFDDQFNPDGATESVSQRKGGCWLCVALFREIRVLCFGSVWHGCHGYAYACVHA